MSAALACTSLSGFVQNCPAWDARAPAWQVEICAIALHEDLTVARARADAYLSGAGDYGNPSVAREISLTSSLALSLGGAFGYKLWTNDPEAEDNTYDIQLDVKLTIPFGNAYVAPTAHVAWTNLAELGLGDDLAVWAGLHLGSSSDEL